MKNEKRKRRNVTRKAAPDYMASIHALISGFQFGGIGSHQTASRTIEESREDLRRFLNDDEFWDALIALEAAAARIKRGGLAK
jgi:hypothetical protein